MAPAIRIFVIIISVCCLLSILGLVAVEFSPAIRAIWIEISDFLRPYVIDGSAALKQYVPQTWTEIKWVFEFVVYFLAAIAAIGTLFRLPKIIQLVQTIRDGHGEIWNLGVLAGKMRDASSEATKATDEMKSVLAEIRENDLVGALEAVQKQLADLQRSSADDSAEPAVQDQAAKSNWEEIRAIWLNAREQLDDVIENITNRTNKRKYARLNHRDYTDIINKLREDDLISDTAARAAGYMNNTYLSFRNQRNPITDNVRQRFIESKKAFDSERKNFRPPPPPSLPPPSRPAPRSDGNGRLPPNTP
jgi:hypothetical protein